jgi:hypothetical protein
MKLLLLILGVVVVALNLFLWYSKKQTDKTKTDESSSPRDQSGSLDDPSEEFLNKPEAAPLKQSAAAELGITIEQLDRLSADEIEELATEKGLL